MFRLLTWREWLWFKNYDLDSMCSYPLPPRTRIQHPNLMRRHPNRKRSAPRKSERDRCLRPGQPLFHHLPAEGAGPEISQGTIVGAVMNWAGLPLTLGCWKTWPLESCLRRRHVFQTLRHSQNLDGWFSGIWGCLPSKTFQINKLLKSSFSHEFLRGGSVRTVIITH